MRVVFCFRERRDKKLKKFSNKKNWNTTKKSTFSLSRHTSGEREIDYAATAALSHESTSAAFVRTARWWWWWWWRERQQRGAAAAAATTTVAFRASSFFRWWWWCESESSFVFVFVSPSSDAIHAFDVCASFFFVASRSAARTTTTASKKLHRRWEWTVPASAAVAEFSVASVVSKSTGTDEWSGRVGGFVHSDEKFRERAKHRFVVVLERGE